MHHDKPIRDVMTPDPSTVEPTTPVIEAARLMKQEDVGSVPIVEDGRLFGTVTDRDITLRLVAEGKDPQSTTVGDIASTDLVTIDPGQTLAEAERLMAQYQVRRLPVCEEDGKLVGIVAQADVATTSHEENVGEVVEQISQ